MQVTDNLEYAKQIAGCARAVPKESRLALAAAPSATIAAPGVVALKDGGEGPRGVGSAAVC